ncbi:MAG: hypothetical protein R6V49_11500, partial [Bacteroidales bacterium]
MLSILFLVSISSPVSTFFHEEPAFHAHSPLELREGLLDRQATAAITIRRDPAVHPAHQVDPLLPQHLVQHVLR